METINKITTEYITKNYLLNEEFYAIPKLLFNSKFSKLSNDAKLLYGIMLSRVKLSVMNKNFFDEDRAYIIFQQKEIMEVLNCHSTKASKLLNELKQFDLVDIKREGFSSPNKIFVKKIEIVQKQAYLGIEIL